MYDNYLAQMERDEADIDALREESKTNGVEDLYRKWPNMSCRQRYDEMMRNPGLIDRESKTHMYAQWADDDVQNEYPLDEPVGTFEEVEEALSCEHNTSIVTRTPLRNLEHAVDTITESVEFLRRERNAMTCDIQRNAFSEVIGWLESAKKNINEVLR